MALIHWWPLNGDTKDYGLNPTATISGTPSYGTGGKIGESCLNTSAQIQFTDSAFNGVRVWSICFWGYVISASVTNNWTGLFHITDGSSNIRVEVCPASYSNGSYCYSIHNNSGNAIFNSSIATSGDRYDCWAHFAMVCNGSTITTYINGNRMGSINYTGTGAITGNFRLINNHIVKKNDFRIYDHALTPKEVKEISKGLVLHYNFEDIESNILTGNFSLNTGTTIDNTTHPFPGKGNIYKLSQSGNTSLVYRGISETVSGVKPGDTIRLSCWIYTENKSSLDSGSELRCYQTKSGGASTNWSGIDWRSSQIDGQWCFHSRQYTLDSNMASTVFNANVVKNGTFWITGIKVEYGTTDTPFTGYKISDTNVYDSSGYGYNGINNGNLPIYSNSSISGIGLHSIKYNSTYTNNIETNMNPSFLSSGMTLVMWVKNNRNFLLANGQSSSYYLMAMDGSSKWNGNTSGTATYYVDGVANSGGRPTDGNWHMYAITLTGGIPNWTKLYFNRHDASWVIDGYVADIKLYATALSASDILKEYQSMANLDKSYNLTARLFNEDCIDYGFMANKGIAEKSFGGHFNAVTESNYYANYPQPNNNALGTYTQSNLSVTMTDNGVRIYSAPNLTTSANGNTMWGGLCWSPMKTYKDCLKTGHRYRLEYHVSGQSSRQFDNGKPYFTNMVGWGQSPDASPTTNSHRSIPSNFQGEMDCYWDFTINDAVFKNVGSSPHSGFSANTSYLAYSSVKLGFTYASTGSLGTDIYITKLHLYDITDGVDYPLLTQNGVYNVRDIDETSYLSAYTPLEYMGFTKTQYIDTEVYFDSNDKNPIDIYFDCRPESSSGINMPIGGTGLSNGWSQSVMLNFCQNRHEFGTRGYLASGSYTPGERYKYHFHSEDGYQYWDQNNTRVGQLTNASVYNTTHFYIGAMNSNYYNGKIYSFSIDSANKRIRNFIPVKRNSDSTFGFLDTTNGKFYTNAGNGTFVGGPELSGSPFFKTYDSGKLIANSFNEN